MGLEHHARITEDAISKEAVMNKIHRLEFPVLKADESKKMKTIYIDADEDHVSLQYLEKKGDIKKPRINTVMPRIIYVYEGVDDEEGRPKLINTKYFGGVYDG